MLARRRRNRPDVILETAAQEQADAGPGSLRDLPRGKEGATREYDRAQWLHHHHAAQHAGGGVGVVEFERSQFALLCEKLRQRRLGDLDTVRIIARGQFREAIGFGDGELLKRDRGGGQRQIAVFGQQPLHRGGYVVRADRLVVRRQHEAGDAIGDGHPEEVRLCRYQTIKGLLRNPQSYDPETYLFTSLMAITSAILVFVLLSTLLPTSDALRRSWFLASARAEVRDLLAGGRSRRLDDETLFRDADRIGQLAALQPAADDERGHDLREALDLFGCAAAVRRVRTTSPNFPLAPAGAWLGTDI
jgi:hypothetical protein